MTPRKRILFLCTGNSARSQIAEALTRHLAAERFEVVSAFVGQAFDYVITVCDRAQEQCPAFPGAEMIHWSFADPAQEPPERQRRAFEAVFNGLSQRIRLLLLVSERESDFAD